MGPTAAGKTQLAVELLKHIPGVIISVDSAMVYRGLDIGTAKPSIEIRKVAPHRLIDICDPADAYSAGRFRADALLEIEKIISQEQIPLLVGGTMLYFHALQRGLSALPQANAAVRNSIYEQAAAKGWDELYAQLQIIDPVAAARIHPHDSQRISRALEIYTLTGKNMTELISHEQMSELPYRCINLAIAPADRSLLHERISQRFCDMLQQGFIAEVERLLERGDLTVHMPSMRAVGYRQVWDYLAGHVSYEQMQEQGIAATRQLAKRQLTWLRGWNNLAWFDSENSRLVEQILQCL